MPQPIEKLNRVVKAITASRTSVYRPPSSKQLPNTVEDAKTDWKLTWMRVYDSCRKELAKLRSENERLNGLMNLERDINKKKSERNKLMQKQLRKEWERTDKREEQIERLKSKLKVFETKKTADAATQIPNEKSVETATQTDAEARAVTKETATQIFVEKSIDIATQIDAEKSIDIATQIDAEVKLKITPKLQPDVNSKIKMVIEHNMNAEMISKFDQKSKTEQEINPKMKPKQTVKRDASTVGQIKKNKTDTEIKKYKCSDCQYSTNKKSSFDDHRDEFCVKAKPVKDMQCKFCKKLKTRRALRMHLNNYLTGQHKPCGLHANFTIAQHRQYREELNV